MQASPIIHAVHALAAGIWLGGLLFTIAVVSPAFKRMNWTPPERIAVRSAVGRQYSKVASLNLLVLLPAACFDVAARGWPAIGRLEIALIAVVCVLSELHARVFAPRLGAAARNGDETSLRKALSLSIGISMLNLLLSLVVAVLAL